MNLLDLILPVLAQFAAFMAIGLIGCKAIEVLL